MSLGHGRGAHGLHRVIAVVVGAALLITLVPPATAATPPGTPTFGSAPVDPYGANPLYACNPTDPHRAGAEGFRTMVLAAYPASRSGDLWSPCNSPNHISTSSHHAGRAWDWFVTATGNRADTAERAIADDLLAWLLDPLGGVAHARARRLGIVEIIWFDQRWSAQTKAWLPYNLQGCPDPAASNTGCHRDHVHFGFSAAGADANTTWWRGDIGWVLSSLDTLIVGTLSRLVDAFGRALPPAPA
jgi:hypothetical protein